MSAAYPDLYCLASGLHIFTCVSCCHTRAEKKKINDLNTDGSFKVGDSNCFENLGNSTDSSRKLIVWNILGNVSYFFTNVCCVYSLALSSRQL